MMADTEQHNPFRGCVSKLAISTGINLGSCGKIDVRSDNGFYISLWWIVRGGICLFGNKGE